MSAKRSRLRPTGILISLIMVVSLFLAACGGGGGEEFGPTTPSSSTSPTAESSSTATLESQQSPTSVPSPTPAAISSPTSEQEQTQVPSLTPETEKPSEPTPTPISTPTPEPVELPQTATDSSRASILDYEDRPPPIASLITIGAPAADGTTQITGSAGSVPGSVDVMVATLDYVQGEFVKSRSDGSFDATVIAAPGATVQVRYDPYDQNFGSQDREFSIHQINPWPGTLIRVSDDLSETDGTPFSGAGSSGAPSGAVLWAAQGSVADSFVEPEGQVSISGTLRIYIPDGVSAPDSLSLQLHAGADLLFDSQGRQAATSSDFISRILTPTGLPIELAVGSGATNIGSVPVTLQGQSGAMVSSFSLVAPRPPNLPDGTYRLFLWIPGGPHLDPLGNASAEGPTRMLGYDGATTAVITLGSPDSPRLSPMMLVDSPNQGTRGTIAEEDRGLYDLSARVATQSERFIVQPRDIATGDAISYRLDPFFPFVSMADRELPIPPLVPSSLPSGELTVTVEPPSGRAEDLGTNSILQARTGQEATSDGFVLNHGGGNPGDVLQLTTLSDSYSYEFQEYGLYTISISGWVADVWGQEYPFNGTFQVWAAETLDLETASLPGTPFEIGDTLPATLNVYPGVPADVEVSFELHPIDGSGPSTDVISGTANSFGYFDGNGAAFEMSATGEYLVTVTASYADNEGRLWMGTRRWGSGVASTSPSLIAHGRRGEDSGQAQDQLAWFSRSVIGVEPGPHHINFPYHSGDVVWATDDDAIQMRMSLQDVTGEIADLMEARSGHLPYEEPPSFNERRIRGELPMLITTSTGVLPTIDLDGIDQWSYAYRSVQRPGVRVREMVATDQTGGSYWRFGDTYLAQRGMGVEGDRPNDIKWQFGAAVFKQPDLGVGEVAIYGSLWVEIDDDDPLGSRVFPPFQGAAGGPSGGPIMTLKGEEIDIFLMPTAVRPGAVLEVGDLFIFAGQVGPPLSSEVSVTVTSPSGQVRNITGQANAVGYFNDSSGGFAVDEPGVWEVDVEVRHEGETSAGVVESPFPVGGVLGTEGEAYQVYVVPRDSQQLGLGLPTLSFASDTPDRPIVLYPRVPEGWTNVKANYIISMAGFVLEQGTVEEENGAVEVVYDPRELNRDFPNIDLRSLSDEVFVSILMEGTDSSGQTAYAAKHITLVGADIYNTN